MTQKVIKKTIEEIEELNKETRYFMAYTLWEKQPHHHEYDDGVPRWVRNAFMTNDNVKAILKSMHLQGNKYEDLTVIPEDILDLNIADADEDTKVLNSYDVNLDVFGNIKENAVSNRTGKSYPYVARTNETEGKTLRNYVYDSRYTFFSALPFFQKYNKYASIANEPVLVVVDDNGKDITNELVKTNNSYYKTDAYKDNMDGNPN